MNKSKHLNSVLIEGEVLYDPSTDEQGVVSFLIVNKFSTPNEEKTNTLPIVATGRLGEISKQNLKKGSEIRIVGRLVQNYFENTINQFPIYILAEHVEIKQVQPDYLRTS